MKPESIAPLTSLRFFFAFFVFLSHLGFWAQGNNHTLKWLFDHVFYEGFIGVSFFFVLSGFVLTLNYKERLAKKKVTYKSFLMARIARIYPMHLLTFLVAIPLTFSEAAPIDGVWIIKCVQNITLTQSFIPFPELYFTFNAVSWSISDEMFFYMVFPFILLAMGLLDVKRNSMLLFAFISINVLLFFILPMNFQHAFLYINPLVRIVDFILGIALCEIFLYLKEKQLNWNFNLLEFGSITLFIAFFCMHELVNESLRYAIYYWVPICCVLGVFAFQRGAISRVLCNKKLVYLGEISFSFYLIHWLAIRYFDIFNKRFFHMEQGLVFVAAIFVFSIIASMISYRWIEKPAAEWIKKRWIVNPGS